MFHLNCIIIYICICYFAPVMYNDIDVNCYHTHIYVLYINVYIYIYIMHAHAVMETG